MKIADIRNFDQQLKFIAAILCNFIYGGSKMKGYRLSILRHGMTEANAKGIYIGKTRARLSLRQKWTSLTIRLSTEYIPHR